MASLRADTALRVFPGGEQCEVSVPQWTGLDGLPYPESDGLFWTDEFAPTWPLRQVGHGSTGGFVVTVRPGQFT